MILLVKSSLKLWVWFFDLQASYKNELGGSSRISLIQSTFIVYAIYIILCSIPYRIIIDLISKIKYSDFKRYIKPIRTLRSLFTIYG